MIKQFTVRDQRGCIAFHICEIMPGVLRLTNAEWNGPVFIRRDAMIDTLLKMNAGAYKAKHEMKIGDSQ